MDDPPKTTPTDHANPLGICLDSSKRPHVPGLLLLIESGGFEPIPFGRTGERAVFTHRLGKAFGSSARSFLLPLSTTVWTVPCGSKMALYTFIQVEEALPSDPRPDLVWD